MHQGPARSTRRTRYKEHCIDQALTVLAAGHNIKCMFTTPKLLAALDEALRAGKLEEKRREIGQPGAGGRRCGASRTRASPASSPAAPSSRRSSPAKRWRRCSTTARLHDADVRQHADGPGVLEAGRAGRRVQDHATTPRSRGPRSRSWIRRTYDEVVEYGQTGRVLLTTLTKEFFVPRFPERDEGEREPPYEKYPVGRRQRRPAVQRNRGHDDRRGILTVPPTTPILRTSSMTDRRVLSVALPLIFLTGCGGGGINQEKFERLKIGMSPQDVQAILGKDGKDISSDEVSTLVREALTPPGASGKVPKVELPDLERGPRRPVGGRQEVDHRHLHGRSGEPDLQEGVLTALGAVAFNRRHASYCAATQSSLLTGDASAPKSRPLATRTGVTHDLALPCTC